MAGVSRVVLAGGMAAIVVILGLGFVAFRALGPTQVSSTSGAAANCAPAPCVNPGPFEIDVTPGNIARDNSSVATIGLLFRLDVTFRNHSNDTMTANGNHERADLLDFSLLDSSGQERRPDYSGPGCAHWDSYEIPQYQVYGPKAVCFLVGSDFPGPFTLRWNPDLGLLSHPYDVRLP
jgi:hypothetical protein